MYACDFEYDGQYLSDYGFVICNLNGTSDFDTVSAGSRITFNTVSRHRGKMYSLTGTQYDDALQPHLISARTRMNMMICASPMTSIGTLCVGSIGVSSLNFRY